MKEFKKIKTCSNCRKQFSISSHGHGIVVCPHCKFEFVFDSGEMVSKKRTKWKDLYWFIFLLLGSTGLWMLLSYSKTPKTKNYINKVLVDKPIRTYNDQPDTFRNVKTSNDFQFTDSLIKMLKEEMLEEAVDKALDILNSIMDRIREEAESGNGKRANERFERTLYVLKNGGKNGKILLERFEGNFAQIKIFIISKFPNSNSLPGSEVILNEDEAEASHASELVRNSTGFTLTLYYNGPTNVIVTIPPGESKQTSLLKGLYRIVAKVDAPSIKELYGARNFKGYSYSIRYYVEMEYSTVRTY